MEVLISGVNHFVSLASGREEDKNIGVSVNVCRSRSASAAQRRGLAGVVLSTAQRRKKKTLLFWRMGSTCQSHTETVCGLGWLLGRAGGLRSGKLSSLFFLSCFSFLFFLFY
jgi:acid phosphatase family membrane protein YuiD